MSDYPAPDDSIFQEPQMDSMEEEPYPKHPCRLCDGFVQAGDDESKWGLDWYKGYVHFSCIENIFDATRRMRNKPEVTQLEAREASARAIMQKFVNKVDTGMARSKETYREMKAWLEE